MKVEVLLSAMNIRKEDLDKMNITSDCVVINQCERNGYNQYKNFKIYSYDELGISKSRNRALENSSKDILLFCDDDVIYYKDYENIILNEFKNNKNADMILFNFDSPNRYQRKSNKVKKLHIYNSLRYGTINIAVKKECIDMKNIKFNKLFGSKEYYLSGEDTLFIVECLKKKLNLYSSNKTIGIVSNKNSSWFKGYNEKYFYDKGALFCAISKKFSNLLFLQYLIRYRKILIEISFMDAYRLMCKGAQSYKNRCNNEI